MKPPFGLKISRSVEKNTDPKLARILKNIQAAKVHLQEVRLEANEAGLREKLENTINIVESLAAELYSVRKVPFQKLPQCSYD